MTELISLLRTLLNDGTIKIDVTIRVSMEDRKIKAEGMHPVTCDKCGWTQRYYDSSAAARGLRSHAHHCTANGVQTGWIDDQMHSTK